MNGQQTIGAELEGALVDCIGRQVNSLEVMKGGFKSKEHPFEELTSDAGISTFEAVSTICCNGRGIVRSLERALSHVPHGLRAEFKTLPFGREVALAPKQRYEALRTALLREHENGAKGVMWVAPWCCTQLQVGMPFMEGGRAPTPYTVNVMNIMNMIAPYARLAAIRELKLEHQKGHLTCWLDWSRPERAPAPRWFHSVAEVLRYVAAIPKLVVQKDGVWVTAENMFSQLGDPGDEGAIWWLARLRGGYKTIEWRPGFPSMPVDKVGRLSDETLQMMEAFRQLVPEERILVRGSNELCELIGKLSEVTYLMPATLPTHEEWWRQFRD